MAEITVRFVSDLPEKYHVAPTPYSLPGDTTVENLNALINDVLGLGMVSPDVPWSLFLIACADPVEVFDYVIDGRYLRTSLQQFREQHSISAVRACVGHS
jgi:hypothetical protein